ncbi:MAG: hypothetical protein HYS89_01410 [Candidatus Colwellbacteria bacterium]|nr:hypothetical protein [Candidatus Colwellbacteria bacterium]
MERLNKKHGLSKVFVAALTLFFSIQPVYASWWNPFSWNWKFWEWPGEIIGWVLDDVVEPIVADLVRIAAGLIIAIIGFLTSIFFAIAGGFISLAIKFNEQIKTVPIIQEGHDIVLAVANLGLVAAIIIIAFMVMFRRADAGQYLFKFAVAALLINFGFFIVTNIFMAPVDALTGVLKDATNFSPFSFAKVFLLPAVDTDNLLASIGGDGPGDEDVGKIGASIASILFSLVFGVLGTLALFAFAGMLFIRAMWLAFLIILLPLAWVTWIFGDKLKVAGGNPWSLWWQQFTRWLLFAPVAMFFFFLSVRLAQDPAIFEGSSGSTSSFSEAVAGMTVVAGLLIGGLMAANKMGITGSGYAIAAAKKGGKWAKARGRLMAMRTVSAPFRTEAGQRLTTRVQQTGAERGLMGRLMTAPVRAGGRGLNILGAKGEEAVKKAADQDLTTLKKNPARLAQAVPSLHGAPLDEAMDFLRQRGLLGLLPQNPDAPGSLSRYIGDARTRRRFQRSGRVGDYEDLEQAAGFNTAVANAARAFEDGTGTLAELGNAVDAFRQATYQTARSVDAIQPRIFRPGNQYGFQDATRQVIAGRLGSGLLETVPETTSRLRTRMNADELDQFQQTFEAHVHDFETRTLPAGLRGRGINTDDKLRALEARAALSPAGSPEERDASFARRLYREYDRMLGSGLLFAPPAPASGP